MTARPTDADLQRATAVVIEWSSGDLTPTRQRDLIAQALADARQPFLDLADEYARDPVIGRAVASAIRAAATRGDQ